MRNFSFIKRVKKKACARTLALFNSITLFVIRIQLIFNTIIYLNASILSLLCAVSLSWLISSALKIFTSSLPLLDEVIHLICCFFLK